MSCGEVLSKTVVSLTRYSMPLLLKRNPDILDLDVAIRTIPTRLNIPIIDSTGLEAEFRYSVPSISIFLINLSNCLSASTSLLGTAWHFTATTVPVSNS